MNPPFTAETAEQKARMAEDAWNTRDTPPETFNPRARSRLKRGG
jgi:nuclear transport factor 2 (NTF2) superfamily protein